jgi:KipI family sensor histidine kinase inhibitor
MNSAENAALPEARLLPLGDAALTVEFGSTIDVHIHARVLGFASALQRLAAGGGIDGVVEWVPTFRSVTVHFDPDRVDGPSLSTQLAALARTSRGVQVTGACWRIPVCFDADFAPDLDGLAAAKSISRERVIELMTQTEFGVYMIGFQPGFSYMGDLPAVLEMPRLATPRKRVPAGSVAVAQRMCAAYPWDSPGGWRLLGRTPVPLFDATDTDRPALMAPGDRVLWQAVERDAYEALQARRSAGTFDRASLSIAPASDRSLP